MARTDRHPPSVPPSLTAPCDSREEEEREIKKNKIKLTSYPTLFSLSGFLKEYFTSGGIQRENKVLHD